MIIKPPPSLVALKRKAINRLVDAVKHNRWKFDPNDFNTSVTPQGQAFSVNRGKISTADRKPRWEVLPKFTAGGNFDDAVTVNVGTLLAPKNLGLNNTAGNPDPEIFEMLPSMFERWVFPVDTFPAEVEAVLGDDVYLELTWTLRLEEVGNLNEDGAPIPLIGFWELTTVTIEGGARPDPVFTWATGTAVTTIPLATVQDDGGEPRILQRTRSDLHAMVPTLSDRSLIPEVNGPPGTVDNGNAQATVTVTDDGSDSGQWLVGIRGEGTNCIAIQSREQTFGYQRKNFEFANGVTTMDVKVVKLTTGSPSAWSTKANLLTCSTDPLA